MSRLQFIVAMVTSASLVSAGLLVVLNGGSDFAVFGWIILVLGVLFLVLNLSLRNLLR